MGCGSDGQTTMQTKILNRQFLRKGAKEQEVQMKRHIQI